MGQDNPQAITEKQKTCRPHRETANNYNLSIKLVTYGGILAPLIAASSMLYFSWRLLKAADNKPAELLVCVIALIGSGVVLGVMIKKRGSYKSRLEDASTEEPRASVQLRLQAIFYSLTALSSAGYVAYTLVFDDMLNATLGSQHEVWALIIVAGSLLLEAILEIPTGALADRYGHHRSVLWSFIAFTIHALLYLVAALLVFVPGGDRNVNWAACGLIILSEIFLAAGLAFQSGSLSSWFTSSMRREGYEGLLHTFMGRRRLTTNVVWLIVGIFILLLKGQKGQDNYRFFTAFAIGILSYVVAALLTRRLVTTKEPEKTRELSVSLYKSLMRKELSGAVGAILQNRKLVFITISHSIFWTLAVTLTYFWQNILDPRSKNKGEGMAIWFALVWVILSLGKILGACLAGRVRHANVGERDARVSRFMIGQLFVGLPMLFVFWEWKYLATGAVLLAISRAGQEFSKPITLAWIHEEVKDDRVRASVESVVEGAAGFVIVLVAVPIMIAQNLPQHLWSTDNILIWVIVFLSCATICFNIPLTWLVTRSAK